MAKTPSFLVSFIVNIFVLILTLIFRLFFRKCSMLKEYIYNIIKQNMSLLRKPADLILVSTFFKALVLTSRKRYLSYSTEILSLAQEKSSRYCCQRKHYAKIFLPSFTFNLLEVSCFAFFFPSHKCGGFQHTENKIVLKRPCNNVEMVIFVWNKRSIHTLHTYDSIQQQQKLRNKILP